MTTGTVTWKRKSRITPTRVLLYGFLIVTSLLWLVPIAGAIFASLRPFSDTVRDGFFSWPRSLTLDTHANGPGVTSSVSPRAPCPGSADVDLATGDSSPPANRFPPPSGVTPSIRGWPISSRHPRRTSSEMPRWVAKPWLASLLDSSRRFWSAIMIHD